MKFDRHGNLWIAAQSDGLIKYNKSDLTQYTFQGKRGPVNMRRLAIDTSGAIWLGTYADGMMLPRS